MDTAKIPPRVDALLNAWRMDKNDKLVGKRIRFDNTELTYVEMVTLACYTSGICTKTIAVLMGRSYKTVDKHLCSARNKLGVHDVVALTHLAIKHKLIIAGEFVHL